MYLPEDTSKEPSDDFQPLPTMADICRDGPHGNQHVHPIMSVEGTDWHAEFTDLVSGLSAERHVLEEFRDSAPTSATAAYVQAIIDIRTEIAAVTGTPF
ncbi:hypothetical protein AB4Y43_16605 [Paraburkholderia sp. BR10872]|uniref:hypothetical protein n=1 Tax=Paraburkholderia sp. BR10872 TaxID=3236989 RepID=UPI0034D28A91